MNDRASHADLHRAFDDYVGEMVDRTEEPETLLVLASLLGRNLREHMRREEDAVLPWWRAAEPEPQPNATEECFLEDHRLLRRQVQELQLEALRAAARETGAWRRRELLAGLDDLLEHHDQRETEHLYARLEQDPAPEARQVREAMGAAPLVPVAQAAAALQEWRAGAGAQVLAAYRAWAAGGEPAESEDWRFLAPEARARARVLAERDRRLVRAFRAADPGDPRRRMALERRVEQTLSRTVLVLMDALLDPVFEGGR